MSRRTQWEDQALAVDAALGAAAELGRAAVEDGPVLEEASVSRAVVL
jgi:hypothetical protein